jgi:RNA polymerase sigma-70 factor (ECF subfamily)
VNPDLALDATAPTRARAGDDEAFCAALREAAPAHHALACRMLGDSDAAGDAVQEAWVRAWLGRDRLRSPDAFHGWMRAIVARECLRALRWRGLRRTLGLERVPEPSVDATAHASLEARAVLDAIERLPARQKVAWVLHVQDGCPIGEVADAMGVGVETVKTHVERARRALKEALDAV